MPIVQQLQSIDWYSLVAAVGFVIAAVVWFAWYAQTKNKGHLFWGAAFLVLAVFFGFSYQYREPDIAFERSGTPSLNLEVRQASTEKVDGWQATTIPHTQQEDEVYYLSPEVELSSDDVAGTGVRFVPLSPKAASRWKGGSYLLVISVALFVALWRDKKWWWGVSGVIVLLLGLGVLAHGLTSTAARFDQQGMWQVVIQFNDAGQKKVARLTAEMAEGRNEQTKAYPKKHLAFLVDGELTFAVPVWEQNTEGVYYLGTSMAPRHRYMGLSKEDAARIAKGIAGP